MPCFDKIFNYAVLLYDKFRIQIVIKGHPTWSDSELFATYQKNVSENEVRLDRSSWSKDKWAQPFIGIFPGTISSTIIKCISSCNSCLFIDKFFPLVVKSNDIVYNIGLHVDEFDDSYVLLEQLLNDTEFRFATITAQLEELKLFADPSKDTVDIFAKEILSFESMNPGKKRILRNISKVINKDKVPISYTYNKAVLEEMRSLYMKYVINLLSLKLKMVNERAAMKMYDNFNPSIILSIKKFMSLIVIGIWIELNFVSTIESR